MNMITLLHQGKPISVAFNYEPAFPAFQDDPGSPETLEIEKVTYQGADVFPLLCEHCLEDLSRQVLAARREYQDDARISRLYPEGIAA